MEDTNQEQWVLRDGIWYDTDTIEEEGIVITDSVVMGDVIQNFIQHNPEQLLNSVKEALSQLGFSDELRPPREMDQYQEVQLHHTLNLANTIIDCGLELDGWTEVSLGYACELEGNIDESRKHFEKALEISQRDGVEDIKLQRNAKLGIAILELRLDNLNNAEKIVKNLRKSFKEDGDQLGDSNATEILGLIAYTRGNHVKAESFHTKSLEIRNLIGDKDGISSSQSNLGNVAMSRGQVDKAANLFSNAGYSDSSEHDEAQLLCNKGVNQMQKGDIYEAKRLINQSLTIRERIGDTSGLTECYNYLGTAYMMQGDFRKGLELCRKSRDNAVKDRSKSGEAFALYNMGQATVMLNSKHRGVKLIRTAKEIYQDIGDKEGISTCNSMLRKLNVSVNLVNTSKQENLVLEDGIVTLAIVGCSVIALGLIYLFGGVECCFWTLVGIPAAIFFLN